MHVNAYTHVQRHTRMYTQCLKPPAPPLPFHPTLCSPHCFTELFITGPDRRLRKPCAKQQQKQQQNGKHQTQSDREGVNFRERQKLLSLGCKRVDCNKCTQKMQVIIGCKCTLLDLMEYIQPFYLEIMKFFFFFPHVGLVPYPCTCGRA